MAKNRKDREGKAINDGIITPPQKKKEEEKVQLLTTSGVSIRRQDTHKKILFMPHIVSIALARKVCAAGYSDGVPLSTAHNRGLS